VTRSASNVPLGNFILKYATGSSWCGEIDTFGTETAFHKDAVEFDQTGLNILSIPVMVQWRNKELVTVWPKDVAKGTAVWKS